MREVERGRVVEVGGKRQIWIGNNIQKDVKYKERSISSLTPVKLLEIILQERIEVGSLQRFLNFLMLNPVGDCVTMFGTHFGKSQVLIMHDTHLGLSGVGHCVKIHDTHFRKSQVLIMRDTHLDNPGVGDCVMMHDTYLENPGVQVCVMIV